MPVGLPAVILQVPTAVAPLHLQLTETVGNFHKWKSPNKETSCLIRLTINTSFFSQKSFSTLFSRIKLFFFFSFPQTTKLNLKQLTTLQQPWTNWLAPTMWTLATVKSDLEENLSKNSFDFLDVKLKVFKRDENKQFRLAQNLTMEEADFNQFNRLRNQLAVAARDFS